METKSNDNCIPQQSPIAAEFTYLFNRLRCKDTEVWNRFQVLADSSNDPLAQAVVAISLNRGFFQKDIPKSKYYCELCLSWLLQQQDKNAYFCLGQLYSDGICLMENTALAREYFKSGAESGCPLSQSAYGNILKMEGKAEEGFEWHLRSAEQDYEVAQYNVAKALQTGSGTEKNEYEAFKLYGLSANQGFPDAMTEFGRCYTMGLGVPRNEREAFCWFLKAAQLGSPPAMTNVTMFYFYGVGGVEVDYIDGAYWADAAVAHGNATGYVVLGWAYRGGRGVAMDKTMAFQCFHTGVARGSEPAIRELATCYEKGEGIERDLVEAKRLLTLGASKGCKKSAERLSSAIYASTADWTIHDF